MLGALLSFALLASLVTAVMWGTLVSGDGEKYPRLPAFTGLAAIATALCWVVVAQMHLDGWRAHVSSLVTLSVAAMLAYSVWDYLVHFLVSARQQAGLWRRDETMSSLADSEHTHLLS